MAIPRLLQPRRSLYAIALLGWVGTFVLFQWDGMISRAARALDVPGDFEKAIHLSEVFAHGFGVAAILFAVFLVARDRRRAVWGAILICMAAGIAANVSKQAVVRIRPHTEGLIQVADANSGLSADERNEGIELVEASFWDARQRSFPSGHAATAWGLAIGLSLVFRRGAWLFAAFAVLASAQRVFSGAHYPSDVFAGMSIAYLAAALLLSIPSVYRLFSAEQPR